MNKSLVQLLIRLPPEEKREFKEACRRSERSVAAQLRLLIRQFIAEHAGQQPETT